MPRTIQASKGKRRSVNLTISEDIMASAKSLNLNVSRAAEAGIAEAVRQARATAWQRENRAAIAAHNARVESGGVLLTPDWAAEE